jgi:phosphatidate phosphatase APP1
MEYRGYEKSIHDLDKTVNPTGVENFMRLQYRTLNHLPREVFVEEIALYKTLTPDEQKMFVEMV